MFGYSYTERNKPVNLQYEFFFNLREDLMCNFHDFTCMLFSVTVQDVESTVQNVEQKEHRKFNGIFLLKSFNRNTRLK